MNGTATARLKSSDPEWVGEILHCLEQGAPVRRDLPGGGRLHIDRPLPFLCVHAADGRQLAALDVATANAAYLVAPALAAAAPLVDAIGQAMLRRFGAYLVIEIAELEEDRLLSPDSPFLPAFETIVTLQDRPALRSAAEAFAAAMAKVPVKYRSPQVGLRVAEAEARWSAGLDPRIARLAIAFAPDLPGAEDRAALSRPPAPPGGGGLRRPAPGVRGVSRPIRGLVAAHASGPRPPRLRRGGRAGGPPHRPDRAIVRLPAGHHPDQRRGRPAGVPVAPVRGGAAAALPAADGGGRRREAPAVLHPVRQPRGPAALRSLSPEAAGARPAAHDDRSAGDDPVPRSLARALRLRGACAAGDGEADPGRGPAGVRRPATPSAATTCAAKRTA